TCPHLPAPAAPIRTRSHLSHVCPRGLRPGLRSLGRRAGDHPRQLERERGAGAFAFALREDPATVLLDDGTHDVEAEPGALHLVAARLEAVEAIEDALQLRRRDADAAIADAHPHAGWRRSGDLDGHLH